jgi:hypothetical protein
MKVDLYIGKWATFRFNIAIAELAAMKSESASTKAMLVLLNNGACGRVAYPS